MYLIVVKKVVSTGGVPITDETLRGNEGDGLPVNKKGGLPVRRKSKNIKLRRDSSGHNDKFALIGGLTPTILELYGGFLDIAGPTVVEIPVVKDTPLVQSSFPKVASTVPGVIIDLGKTLDNTLHL
ncbi:MAG: hypothetical protein JSY10_17915 [Paenibacillus sp.]|nr:hypothetical protein [Paenibacillus sp.]